MRLLVFGNSGSGKSWLARRTATQHGLRLLDLDTVVWGDFAVLRPEVEVKEELTRFLQAGDAWVIEGCYGRWMEYLLPCCTELIFMNPGEAICRSNCLARPWEPHKYGSKEEQDAQLAFLLDWVHDYYVRSGDMSLQAHRRVYDSFTGMKREIAANQRL